jgi:site-specific DNA-methyltransferase (adenine-specific)
MAWDVRHADCLVALRELPDASVDAAVTDPPYELGFMGRGWDASGIAFRVELWREVLRVLRPGGHLLSCGGTRTYHRMACAVEDAGFEIRDSILAWLYGQGFPKSLDVARAIDESLCKESGRHFWHETSLPRGDKARPGDHVCARTELGTSHDGEGTALKPSAEPIIVARKPLEGTVAENVLRLGTGALNIDGCRLAPGMPDGRTRDRAGEASRGAVYAEDSADFHHAPGPRGGDADGRWPPNVVLTHDPRCNATCAPGCAVAALDRQSGDRGAAAPVRGTEPTAKGFSGDVFGAPGAGREPAPFYGDKGGASRFFPTFAYDAEDFLYCAKPSRSERDAGLDDVLPTSGGEATERADGSAGTQSPRAGAGRNGGAKNFHPTVKPVRLMEWLVRLVTPVGGLVLDPFTGSGTTGCAAVRQGFDFIGFEREEPFVRIATRRIALAAGAPRAKAIGELVRLKPTKEAAPEPQLGLFGRTA